MKADSYLTASGRANDTTSLEGSSVGTGLTFPPPGIYPKGIALLAPCCLVTRMFSGLSG